MPKKILVLSFYVIALSLIGCGAPRIIDDADEVTFDYAYSFPDGTLFQEGKATMIVGAYSAEIFDALHEVVLGAQVGDVLGGVLSPDQTYADAYDFSLQQKLAEGYFYDMESLPEVGDVIYYASLWTGVVFSIQHEEDIKRFVLEFNPVETYTPLHYSLKITKIVKR